MGLAPRSRLCEVVSPCVDKVLVTSSAGWGWASPWTNEGSWSLTPVVIFVAPRGTVCARRYSVYRPFLLMPAPHLPGFACLRSVVTGRS